MKYAFFDGDNVGNAIEILLLENKILEAQTLSNNITQSLIRIKTHIINLCEILIVGGDDLLVKVDNSNVEQVVDYVVTNFKADTGLTISCGIGNTIQSSIYQLSLSKLYGKNQIKSE